MGTASVVSWRVIPFPCSFGWLYNASASASALSFVRPASTLVMNRARLYVESQLAPTSESLAQLVDLVNDTQPGLLPATAVKAICDHLVGQHLATHEETILPHTLLAFRNFFANVSRLFDLLPLLSVSLFTVLLVLRVLNWKWSWIEERKKRIG